MKIIFSSSSARRPQHRVSLVEAIYYREMASGHSNTYSRHAHQLERKFIVICVVFLMYEITLARPPTPRESRRNPLWLLLSTPPSLVKTRRTSAPCLRVRCTANVYVAYTTTKQAAKKKGRITYIKRQLDRWKVCFFILRKNILRIFSKFGLMWCVLCFSYVPLLVCNVSLKPEIANRSTRKDAIRLSSAWLLVKSVVSGDFSLSFGVDEGSRNIFEGNSRKVVKENKWKYLKIFQEKSVAQLKKNA